MYLFPQALSKYALPFQAKPVVVADRDRVGTRLHNVHLYNRHKFSNMIIMLRSEFWCSQAIEKQRRIEYQSFKTLGLSSYRAAVIDTLTGNA